MDTAEIIREKLLAADPLVVETCSDPDNPRRLFSEFISTKAKAIRFLGAHGLVTVTGDNFERCVDATVP